MTDDADRIAEIDARLEKATEPVVKTWVAFGLAGPPDEHGCHRARRISNGHEDVVAAEGGELVAREDDLLLICHAPHDLRFLREKIESLKERLEVAGEVIYYGQEGRDSPEYEAAYERYEATP